MREHAWKIGAITGALAGVGFLLSEDALVREAIWCLTLLGACVAIVVGVRLHRPVRRHPWWILLGALSVLAAANVVNYPAWSTSTTLLIADTLALLAFPLLGMAALAISRLQAPGGDRESAIDGAIVMVAMATVLAGTVFTPESLGENVTVSTRILNTAVAPLTMAAVTAAVLRLLFVGSVRVASAWFFFSAALFGMVGNTLRAVLTAEGVYERGVPTDLLVLLSYVAVPLAALHPSSGALTERADPRHRRFTLARLGILGASLIAAPATLVIQDPGEGFSLPVASSVVLSLLVLWRLGRLVVEREAARKELHLRAEQQEALAELGLTATHEQDLEGLTADAERRCTELLDLRECEVADASATTSATQIALPISSDGWVLRAARSQPFSHEDVAFLQAVANVLAAAVERHATHELMRSQAIHDGLTGLPNRVHLIDHLEQAHATQRRSGGRLVVMFIDLDRFKRINDEHGHRAGDQLLIAVADRLRATVRAGDMVGRLAGDEFVVISEGPGLDEAQSVADRLVAALAEPYELEGATVSVGVSLGIAVADDAIDNAEELLARADLAMYAAKASPKRATSTFEPAGHG